MSAINPDPPEHWDLSNERLPFVAEEIISTGETLKIGKVIKVIAKLAESRVG